MLNKNVWIVRISPASSPVYKALNLASRVAQDRNEEAAVYSTVRTTEPRLGRSDIVGSFQGSSLVDGVENCLPILLNPMFCLAQPSCSPFVNVSTALD